MCLNGSISESWDRDEIGDYVIDHCNDSDQSGGFKIAKNSNIPTNDDIFVTF